MRPLLPLLVWLALACGPAQARPPAGSPPPAATQEVRLLALGDSFTIGTGSSPEQAFPARLAERWRAARRTVVLRNLAVNGYTTRALLDRELPEVAGFKPSLVTLAIGANDIVRGASDQAYQAALKEIFDGLARAGVAPAQVVALPQPDWSLSPVSAAFGEPAELARRIERFNSLLQQEARARGARYVDLFPLMRRQAQQGMLAPDQLHPSAAAHAAWAEALEKELSRP